MSKNNIIDFPATNNTGKKSKKIKKIDEVITHLFQDKDGNQIFLKDHTTKKNKYLISEVAEKVEIKRGDNVILYLNVDTEFNDYVGILDKITYE